MYLPEVRVEVDEGNNTLIYRSVVFTSLHTHTYTSTSSSSILMAEAAHVDLKESHKPSPPFGPLSPSSSFPLGD